MLASIESLPYELLSAILAYAASVNLRESQQYTYGLSSGVSKHGEHVLRGQLATDAAKWNAVDAIRRVKTLWHDWACDYALQDLYIRRWRGSERWKDSRALHMIQGDPSSEVVYRDPYCSLRKTVNLFTSSPNLANSVGRIVFDGFYSPETNVLILQALQNCNLLDCVSLPWTVLRYGTVEDWSKLLAPKQERSALSSLELLAVDLKQSQIMDQVRRFDKRPLESPQVSFEHLKRLKLFGSSNLMPINDDDLVAIARTAQLEEIHITGTTSISTKGLMALGRASRETLRILEHSPLSDDGFKHPDAARPHDDSHLCREIVGCPRLKSLAVSLPTLCRELFMDHSVSWAGDVQIRAGGLCGNELSLRQSIEAQRELFDILSQARTLIEARQESGIELNIELFIEHLIFEPAKSLVHADITAGELLSDGSWPTARLPSSKGPWGQTGQYGKDEAAYSCISEEDLAEGLRRGYISF